MTQNSRLLIIRFSSFGDIVQAEGVPADFTQIISRIGFPGTSEVDWLVRSDFAGLLTSHPKISRVIPFPREKGLSGLLKLAWTLAGSENKGPIYTHLYDAHNNLRSNLFCLVFRLRHPLVRFARRPKSRLRRWLFFKFKLPVLPRPFRGAESFHWPLTKWGSTGQVPGGPQFFSNASLATSIESEIKALKGPRIALAPSAAWEMKRWPEEHWRELIKLMPEASFILLGGPEDKFIENLCEGYMSRTLNLAGKLRLEQNAKVFELVDLIIANDTGLLHVADQMERPLLALIGPTAFGYPSHPTSRTLEIDLWCKPCTKDGSGKCVNELYKRCLIDLFPERVAKAARDLIGKQT